VDDLWDAHGSLIGVPATGRRVEFLGLDMFRLSGGKIVEQWAGDDMRSLPRQIGALSANR
jgi:predicted ester cyclase